MHRSVIPTLLALTAILATGPSLAAGPDAQAQRLIAELGLREAATPSSAIPDWRPRRVLVYPLSRKGIANEQYAAALRAVAGDVQVIMHEKGAVVPSRETLAGVDAVLGMCNPGLLKRADASLRWVHNYSVGMERCQGLSPAQQQQMTFTNNQRLSAPTIAEHSIAMLLALTRKLPAYQRAQAQAQWQRGISRSPSFGELPGKTLLVAGLGGIGTEIARRAHALGMRVVATRNSSREGPDFVDYVGLSDELYKLAGQADVVVNALPLTSKTTGLFDRRFFAALKRGAIFLSVGRGGSTVTADLVSALADGSLYGAGLDVTDPEPLPSDHPLWRMDNVIITPHVAATGGDSAQRSMTIAVENLRRYVAGEPLLNVVDIERGY